MATGGLLQMKKSKEDDYRHSCALCMERYQGRNPKILPCFHSFCLPCLTALAEKTSRSIREKEEMENKSDVDRKDDGSETGETKDENDDEKEDNDYRGITFPCPLCREPVIIPEGGVAALKNNIYLEVDASEDTEPSLCQMCVEGAEKEATHYCQECDQRMCPPCKITHGRVRILRGHNVEPVSSKPAAKPAKNPGQNKRWCQYHPDQVLCFHCCKCDISICLHCKLTSHEGHETEDMVTAARRANEELAGVITKAKEQVRSVKACINRLERDEQDLLRQKQEIEQQINTRHDILIARSARAREEVLEVLVAKAEIALSDITMEKTSACVAKETILEVMSRASVKASYGPDLVMLKSELQAALLKDETADRFKDLAARKEQKTFLTCTADTSALDLDLMRMYMGEMGEVKDAGSAMSLTFREMAAKITTLESALKDLNDTKMTALEATVKGLADRSQIPKVSFHVTFSTNGAYSYGQYIVFNQIHCNDGNGYNTGNGVFTAPENGTYVFMASIQSGTNAAGMVAALHVKGTLWAYMSVPQSATVHAAVNLTKGEQVWVQSCSNSIYCNTAYSFFSGALVSG